MKTVSRSSRKNRRNRVRESARLAREVDARHRQRRRTLVQVAVTSFAAVVLISSIWLFNSLNQRQLKSSDGPENMISDGLLLQANGPVLTPGIPAGQAPTPTTSNTAAGALSIVIYYDYLCPYCALFEKTNGDLLKLLLKDGASLELHPITILPGSSVGAHYSERAANAFACVSNFQPEAALSLHSILFANQPSEDSAGLTDNQLIELAAEAGVRADQRIDKCISDLSFLNWVEQSTHRALTEPIPNSDLHYIFSTPTVLVNGHQYKGDPSNQEAFKRFISQTLSG